MVGHYNVDPVVFWKITMAEAENIHEARRSKMVGNMHENEYLELIERREASEAKGVKVM